MKLLIILFLLKLYGRINIYEYEYLENSAFENITVVF